MFNKILELFKRFSGLFLFLLGCINFCLAYKTNALANRSCVVTNLVNYVSSEIHETSSSTNFPSSLKIPDSSTSFLSSPSIQTSTSSETNVCEVARWPYRYFVIGRRIGVEFMGRYLYEGSPCSYGRIYQIYPDRILLVSGDWISNTLLPLSEERKKHEFR